MRWNASATVDQRMRFILDHESGLFTMTELSQRYGVSRQTSYKWLERYRAGGVEALQDRSRAPHRRPQRMEPPIEAILLEARRTHPHWGPRKILHWLRQRRPEHEALPAPSTVGELFKRHGLIESRRRRKARASSGAGALRADSPNEVWTADFKGEFRLGGGPYCYPFTLADAHSRFVLSCNAEPSTALQGPKRGMTQAFRQFGMPLAIRTDNGTPFAAHGGTELSQLGVWWIKLGIVHQRIDRGRPDQNGRHERMHRTLKAETARPPQTSFSKQQARFDSFVEQFNQERPHEALDNQTPASCYQSSAREFPERLARPEYPGYFEHRLVDSNGAFKFRGRRLFLAHPLAGEWLGLHEIEEEVWSVCFYDRELGRLNLDTGEFIIKVSTMSPV